MTQSLDVYRSFMECQIRKNAADKGKRLENPFVTISRQSGAGGNTIIRLLAEYLNAQDSQSSCPWAVFDKELVHLVAEAHHLPPDIEKFMAEKKTSEMRDVLETMIELHPPAFALVKKTSETIYQLAAMGNAVIVGRGANLITQKLKGGLHVRITGPLEKRIQHAADYYKLSYEEASKKVKTDDKNRKDYIKQNFGKDIDQPDLYDLIISMEKISYEAAAKLIAEAVLSLRAAGQING